MDQTRPEVAPGMKTEIGHPRWDGPTSEDHGAASTSGGEIRPTVSSSFTSPALFMDSLQYHAGTGVSGTGPDGFVASGL